MIVKYVILCAIYSMIICNSNCARILGVFPIPSISHQVIFRPLMHELAKRGHEVIIVTPDPAFAAGNAPKNLIEIDVHDLSYKNWNAYRETNLGNPKNLQEQIKVAMQLAHYIFEQQVQHPEFKKIHENPEEKFDLIIIECMVRLPLVFSHIFNAPVIQFSSFGGFHGTFEDIGGSVNELLYPMVTRRKFNNLTFWEKIEELYTIYCTNRLVASLENKENEILKRLFGPDIPEISELKNNIHMVFLNTYPMIDFNRPVPPNVLYVGGIHQQPNNELPKDLKSYLDASAKGVIYISFGTNIVTSIFSHETIKTFTNVISKLPYNILWKWDSEIPGRPNNTLVAKWFPQSDLLKHPNIKLFITQGGLQSTDEALTAGVPLLGFPMGGDQFYNTEQYLKHKIGLKLNIETVTEYDLKNAIETLIENESYRQNVIRLRTLLREQSEPPLKRAVWWAEYVIKYGGTHLRSPTFNMPWIKHCELECIFIAIAIILGASICVVILLIKKIARKLLRSMNKIKTN